MLNFILNKFRNPLPKERDNHFFEKVNTFRVKIDELKILKMDIILMTGSRPFKLDDISYTEFYEKLIKLKDDIINFLYYYQNEKKYISLKKMKKIIENDLWLTSAEPFIFNNQNYEILIIKILEIFSFLNYLNDSSYFIINELYDSYFYYQLEENVYICDSNKSEHLTIKDILEDLLIYEDGFFGINENGRKWGLKKSSFYCIVLFDVLTKIID